MAKKYRNININLEFVGVSRKKVKAGDIFVMKMKPLGKYLWGRVIRTDACAMSRGSDLVVYIYNTLTEDKEEIPPELDKDNLLIPPQIINTRGWLDGYYETVANVPLTKKDILPHHCFKDVVRKVPTFCNEYGEQLPAPIEPCGIFALGNYRSVDDKVSMALGIPLAPVDEEDKDKIPEKWKDNPDIKWGEE